MPSITTLETAKAHLRVDGNSDDAMIQIYIDAAEAHVNDWCDKGIEPFIAYPAPVSAAVLLIVGDLYENREAQGMQLYRNRTVDYLLQPYRNVSL